MQFTRRSFLKLVTVGVAGVMLGGSRTGNIEGEGDNTRDNIEPIAEFLSARVERAFQADSLPGTNIFVAGYFTSWNKAIPSNPEQLSQFKAANDITSIKEGEFVPNGTVLMVPEETGLCSDQETIVTRLHRQLLPRLVMTPGVSPERQFLSREFSALSTALRNVVTPFLDRSAPEPAVKGLVLLGRAPDGLAATYAEDSSHAAVSRLDYVASSPNAFSYVRDVGGSMVLKKAPDGRVFTRRIYLLREPTEGLKAKILSGNFLTTPEWGAYYFGTMNAMAHEAMHSIVTRDYHFPPFDNHSVVRAVSFACVLDYLHSGRGNWKQGSLPKAVWSMPELQVLKVYPTFYKDLFAGLRKGKEIGTTAFDEADVVAVSDALFAAQTLGSFYDRWDQWKDTYDKATHGQRLVDEEMLLMAISRLGKDNVAMAHLV